MADDELVIDMRKGQEKLAEVQREAGWNPEASMHTAEEVLTYLAKLEATVVGITAAYAGMADAQRP